MNEILQTTLTMLPALLLSVGLSVALSAWFFNRMLKAYKKAAQQDIHRQANQIKILTSGSIGLGNKILALEAKLEKLTSDQEELKTSDVEFSFTQAQKMIEQGLDSDSVAATSGLSASEIQLMELIHKKSTRNEFEGL